MRAFFIFSVGFIIIIWGVLLFCFSDDVYRLIKRVKQKFIAKSEKLDNEKIDS